MPELPEVERAVRALRKRVIGKTIAHVLAHHRAHAKRLSARARTSLAGATVVDVHRRGKHQILRLSDGRSIHVHFRMTGDWTVDAVDDPLPRFGRVSIEFSDGTRAVLDDPRALSTVGVHSAGHEPQALARLGPEPSDRSFDAAFLRRTLGNRRVAIKPALLDQRVVAGLGNIYAAEALWLARIDPRRPAARLTQPEAIVLVRAIRQILDRASGTRYRAESPGRFAVYDREGRSCRRCRGAIERIQQSGRSTYFCPRCQR